MEGIYLITLLLLGLTVFFAVQFFNTRMQRRREEKIMKGYFLLGLSGLLAKVAMADGRVTGDEAAMAEGFFASMGLTDAERALCIGNFVTARRDGLDVRDHAQRFMAYANTPASFFLYSLLWKLSRADGKLDPAEDSLLKRIAACLGLTEACYDDAKAGTLPKPAVAELAAAGVPPSLLKVAESMSALERG